MIMELRINIDERDLNRAREMTGISDPQALLNHVLNQFVRVISLETLTKGGWDPHLGAPPRRRPPELMNDAPESPAE
jgi:hypothetical protein